MNPLVALVPAALNFLLRQEPPLRAMPLEQHTIAPLHALERLADVVKPIRLVHFQLRAAIEVEFRIRLAPRCRQASPRK